jgi:hypothetical protein
MKTRVTALTLGTLIGASTLLESAHAQPLETARENPDGRNHLCAPPASSSHPADNVFCFSLGGGT